MSRYEEDTAMFSLQYGGDARQRLTAKICSRGTSETASGVSRIQACKVVCRVLSVQNDAGMIEGTGQDKQECTEKTAARQAIEGSVRV